MMKWNENKIYSPLGGPNMGGYDTNGIIFFGCVGFNDWVGCWCLAAWWVKLFLGGCVEFTFLVEWPELVLDFGHEGFSTVRGVKRDIFEFFLSFLYEAVGALCLWWFCLWWRCPQWYLKIYAKLFVFALLHCILHHENTNRFQYYTTGACDDDS